MIRSLLIGELQRGGLRCCLPARDRRVDHPENFEPKARHEIVDRIDGRLACRGIANDASGPDVLWADLELWLHRPTTFPSASLGLLIRPLGWK